MLTYGKQESLESSQESRNQAKIPKDSESHRTNSIVSDPSVKGELLVYTNKSMLNNNSREAGL